MKADVKSSGSAASMAQPHQDGELGSSSSQGRRAIVALPKARIDLATRALYEITCISSVVRELDPEDDHFGVVIPAMMARIQKLSECVSELIDREASGGSTDYELVNTINCKHSSPEDVDAIRFSAARVTIDAREGEVA